MQIAIVGAVAAGMSAALRAKRQCPSAEVTVYERGEYPSYGACGLPYVIGGEVSSVDQLLARTPQQLRAQGVHLHLRCEVVGIDPRAQTLSVQTGGGPVKRANYDRLLLATGVSPRRPEWWQGGVAGVHTLRDIPSAQAIAKDLKGARRAIIVGGGYIGLELAEALRARGLSVALLERDPALAGRILDPLYQRQVSEELQKNKVDVRCGLSVEGFSVKGGQVTGVHTSDGLVRGDLVIVATGVQPNVALAQAAGVRLGRTGAIAVNKRQETNVAHIYAAGDNAQSLHRVTRRQVHIPLGLAANRMGRVAGINMGGGHAEFPGVVGSAIFKTFGLGVARTGLTQQEAEQLGLAAYSVDISTTDHASYYPDAAPISARLTAEQGSGRLLGAQLLGRPASVKRIDVVAALLHSRGKVQALAEMDLAYAPPFSGVWDVLLVAAGEASKRLT